MNEEVMKSVWRKLPKPRQRVGKQYPPSFTTEEFKERIKAICGPRIGPSNPLLTRTPADKGYYKPKQ